MKFFSSKHNSKEIIDICFVTNNQTNISLYKQIFNWSKEYLNLNVTFVSNNELENFDEFIKRKFNFYFIDYTKEFSEIFAWDFYAKKHAISKNFKLVFILKKYNSKDYILFKNGADDIIYNNENFIDMKWKFFSLLRRLWDYSHKDSTLIHNGIIIDLNKRIGIKNNKVINITNKEFQLLEILVNEFNIQKNAFISKNFIYKKIYHSTLEDNTRLVDQLIFRLKNKLGKEFFETDSKKGIKIK